MDQRRAAEDRLTPEAAEFVRFCYRRRKLGWPELYDEMCAVASRGLYRGWGPAELAEHGIGFSLFQTPALAALAARVVAEEQAKRRAPTVALVGEPATVDEDQAVGREGGPRLATALGTG